MHWLKLILPELILTAFAFLFVTLMWAAAINVLLDPSKVWWGLAVLGIGFTLYIVSMKKVAARVARAFNRYDLAPFLSTDEYARAGAGDTPTTLPDRRRGSRMPRPVPGSDAAAEKVVKVAAHTAPAPKGVAYTLEFVTRAAFGTKGTSRLVYNITHENFGKTYIPEIRAWLEADTINHEVTIDPPFDLRLWNLAQRQTREGNVATIALVFPRFLLQRTQGLIY